MAGISVSRATVDSEFEMEEIQQIAAADKKVDLSLWQDKLSDAVIAVVADPVADKDIDTTNV